jgi:hypothetical protein
MSYKSPQLSPLSTRGANLRSSISGRWSVPRVDYHEVRSVRSWLIYDPELDTPRGVNQDVMLGMALVIGVSASFWAGLGLVIAHVWK